ncbi:MAG: acyl carrier protein [Opitutaceae bacterium]|nr:acyl carrier protein [Opitutaceae bacterium]
MAEAANTTWGAPGSLPGSAKTLPPADDAYLREALKHYPASIYPAACRFRQTGNTQHLPAIVRGIIERHVPPDLRARLKDVGDDLRLAEDLGLDSLTMMEVVALTEDVFRVSISSEELGRLRTLGDLRQLLTCKLCGLPGPASKTSQTGGWD